MKLFSTNRNSMGKQLVCDDAVFDPDLITELHIDAEEKVVTFQYDFSECGHPLNLPFDAQTVDFLVKFTKHDIHICAMVDVDDEIDELYDDYVDDMSVAEFDVRMSVEEKYALLLALFLPLFNKTKTREPIPTKSKDNEAPNTSQKEYIFNDNSFKKALEELLPEIFGGNILKGKK